MVLNGAMTLVQSYSCCSAPMLMWSKFRPLAIHPSLRLAAGTLQLLPLTISPHHLRCSAGSPIVNWVRRPCPLHPYPLTFGLFCSCLWACPADVRHVFPTKAALGHPASKCHSCGHSEGSFSKSCQGGLLQPLKLALLNDPLNQLTATIGSAGIAVVEWSSHVVPWLMTTNNLQSIFQAQKSYDT